MPAGPFTRAQSRQNARYLRALARTGNSRLAAQQLNVHRSTYTKRRAANARFAALWDAALAYAHATASTSPPACGRGLRGGQSGRDHRSRAIGGEPILVRLANGRVQLRRAPRGRMTKAAEQAFLAALSATCNVRLSAAAAGFTHSAFYQKAKKDPGFRREWRLARQMGHERLELALLEGFGPESHEDDAWRHNDPPPIPPMTPHMAIQLLAMHRKRVDHGDLPDPMRRRPGESREAMSMRLSLMYQERLERDREAYRVAEAARNEQGARQEAEDGEGIAALPALGQVTGWSKAAPEQRSERAAIVSSDGDGACRPTGPRSGARSTPRDNGRVAKVHNPDIAMFGGWRITDWKKRQR